MKKMACASIICLLVFSVSIGWAESKIPNLVGKWKGQIEAGLLIFGEKPSDITHRDSEYSKGETKLVLEKQQGRIIHGYYQTEKAKERVVAVIAHDNKTLHMVDHDGFAQFTILTPDKMQGIYVHAKPSDSEAAAVIFVREK